MKNITIIGNVVAQATVTQVNDRSVINFIVAVNNRHEQNEPATFFACSYWRPNDKLKIANFLLKGTKVFVRGNPEISAYMSTKTQQAVGQVKITVESIELLSNTQPEQTEIATTNENEA